MIKKKIFSAGLAVMMLAGCTAEEQTGAIMANVDGTDVPFGAYQTYIDLTDEMARLIAHDNLGYSEMIMKDLNEWESGIDFSSFNETLEQIGGATLDELMVSEALKPTIDLVVETSGMTVEEYRAAALLDYMPQVLTDYVNEYFFYESGEDAEAYMTAVEEYSANFEERTDVTNPELLATIDGVEIPMTEEYKNYLDYTGLMARANAIHTISLNKVAYDRLVENGLVIDEAGLQLHKDEVYAVFEADQIYTMLLPRALANLGITEEEYNASLDAYLELSYASTFMDAELTKEYEALEGDKPETATDYVNEYFIHLSENTTIVALKA